VTEPPTGPPTEPPTGPSPAGPRARFSESFIGMFEALRMAPTFAKGRRDARAGHVRNLTISGSLVVAQVRGPEEPTASRARIAVRAFGAAEWARVEDDLASQARYVADLLAGRMPAGIEAVFDRAGLSLLPLSIGEVAMDCACERWPMPCAHLAATIYALAASFDTDPFGVFAWRGRGRDELLMRLHQLRGVAAVSALDGSASTAETAEPGLGDLAAFWGSAPSASPVPLPAAVTGVRPDALLDQLDPPPLAVDGRPVIEILRPAYRAMPAAD
jgi:uncharacterized Zn finger protein